MRSFPLLYITLFFIFFLINAAASRRVMNKIFPKQDSRLSQWIFWGVHFLVLTGFTVLYIYPFHPREATNYPLYFYFNAVLFVVLIFDLPLSFSLLLHWVFERKTDIIPHSGFIISLGIVVVLIYGILFGNQQLKINSFTLHYSNLPASFHDFRVVQISDIHMGSMLKSDKLPQRARKKIRELNPDLLLFTGDIVNNYADELDGFKQEIKKMTQDVPAYSILGNHDYGDYTDWKGPHEKQHNFVLIQSLHSETGFTLLNNENKILRRGKDSIFIAGVENWGHSPFPQYADIEKALQGIPPEAFTLFMTHDPAHWESKVEGKRNIELTLSGHTHGMQWGIKTAGIPFSLAYLTRKYWGGLYRNGTAVLHVNTGLGMVGVPWRIDMAPEITVFTLKSGEIN